MRVYSGIGWHDMKETQHATKESLDNRSIYRHDFSKTMMALYTAVTEYAVEKNLFVK
jgi:hypothetical protein